MFKKILLTGLSILALQANAWAADISAKMPYAFQTTTSQKTGAVFVSLTNTSQQDRALIKATSDIANKVEIHTMGMAGGVMEMRRIDKLDIPAGEDVLLKPMGYHIMLIGLKKALAKDSHFPVTLEFDNGEALALDVQIMAAGTNPNNHTHHSHQH